MIAAIIGGTVLPAWGRTVSELEAFLAKDHISTDEQRRAVLAQIYASVPDAQGKFQTPARNPNEKHLNKDLDWLAELSKLAADTPGIDEVTADVTAIRALAATQDFDAARILLEFAFTEIGIIYRDECGRYLRAMSPYSVPALHRAMMMSQRSDMVRYARYQLERLDREEPSKALTNAGTDDVRVALLKAYNDTKDRAAVLAVLRAVNHVSPRVSAQARTTWRGYITGPPPKPAPKRKLQLAGGKYSDEELPLWLTSRELAEIELRRLYKVVLARRPKRRAKLTQLTDELFAHYDAQREQANHDNFAKGSELAAQGKHAEATILFDSVLVAEPLFGQRAQMAPAFAALGAQQLEAAAFDLAAKLFGKAYAVAPDAPDAHERLANQHYAYGRMQQAAGTSGQAAFKAALAAWPEHSDAKTALADAARPTPTAKSSTTAITTVTRPAWMLYASIGGGAVALILILAAHRRRMSRC